MKKYKLILIIFSAILFIFLSFYIGYGFMFNNKSDSVLYYELSGEIAIQIGKIILIDKFPILNGEGTQFRAVDSGDSWRIYNDKGDLYTEEGEYIFQMGGVYCVEIRKSNCEILSIEIHD